MDPCFGGSDFPKSCGVPLKWSCLPTYMEPRSLPFLVAWKILIFLQTRRTWAKQGSSCMCCSVCIKFSSLNTKLDRLLKSGLNDSHWSFVNHYRLQPVSYTYGTQTGMLVSREGKTLRLLFTWSKWGQTCRRAFIKTIDCTVVNASKCHYSINYLTGPLDDYFCEESDSFLVTY